MFEMTIRLELTASGLEQAIHHLADALVVPIENNTPEVVALPEATPVEPVAAPSPVAVPDPVPAPIQEPVPVAEPVQIQQPIPEPTPAPIPAPVAEQPVVEAKPIDMATLSRAGASLVDQGKMPRIMELLKKYNVQAITQLTPEQLPLLAADFRALGADI